MATGRATRPLLLFMGDNLKALSKMFSAPFISTCIFQPQEQEYIPRCLRFEGRTFPQAWQVLEVFFSLTPIHPSLPSGQFLFIFSEGLWILFLFSI
jgi:hypothetical protein